MDQLLQRLQDKARDYLANAVGYRREQLIKAINEIDRLRAILASAYGRPNDTASRINNVMIMLGEAGLYD